jgi:hypothetical protein
VGAGLTGNQPVESASRAPFERAGVTGCGRGEQQAGNQPAVPLQERRDECPRRRDHRQPPPKKAAKSAGVLSRKVRTQYSGRPCSVRIVGAARNQFDNPPRRNDISHSTYGIDVSLKSA